MKTRLGPVFAGWLCVSGASAQTAFPVTPATPTDFKMRPIGNTSDAGATVAEIKRAANVRYVSHISFGEDRIWTSTEGKPVRAKLIAFEDLVAEAPQGAPQPAMPAAPATPTVVRDGRARLLVNGKAMEIALDRLSSPDREFIEGVRASFAKKAE